MGPDSERKEARSNCNSESRAIIGLSKSGPYLILLNKVDGV